MILSGCSEDHGRPESKLPPGIFKMELNYSLSAYSAISCLFPFVEEEKTIIKTEENCYTSVVKS